MLTQSKCFKLKTQNRWAENIRHCFLQYLTYSGTSFLMQGNVFWDAITPREITCVLT